MNLLQQLAAAGILRPLDHALAQSLRRLDPDTPDSVLAAAALASLAVANGHAGFAPADPGRLVDADIDWPPPAAWRTALAASRWVSMPQDADTESTPDAPLVLEGEGGGLLYLRRYREYERRLAHDLQRIGAHPPDTGDLAALAPLFAQLFPRALSRDGSSRDASSGMATAQSEAGRASTGADDEAAGTSPARGKGRATAAAEGASRADIDTGTPFPQARRDNPTATADTASSAPDCQAQAAALALRHNLLLVTGGPGTGKTTTITRLLVLLAAQAQRAGGPAPRIALAAPTGRAAERMAESVRNAIQVLAADGIDPALLAQLPTTGTTLHRLLGTIPDSPRFRHHADNPLPYDTVVVDEASMIDLPLMAKLVDAIADGARLVLLGDPDQLPSVEAGDVLSGILRAGGDGDGMDRDDAAALQILANSSVATIPLPRAGAIDRAANGLTTVEAGDVPGAAPTLLPQAEEDARRTHGLPPVEAGDVPGATPTLLPHAGEDARRTHGLPAFEAGSVPDASATLLPHAGEDARTADGRSSVEAGAVPGATPTLLPRAGEGARRADEGALFPGRRIHLQRGYRQSAALDLVPLAAAVRGGDADAALSLLRTGALAGVQFHEGQADPLQSRRAQFLAHWRTLAHAGNPAAALALASRLRILTAVRQGPQGARGLNTRIESLLSEDGSGAAQDRYFHGRLLLVTENSYRHRLFNGDIGVCFADDSGAVMAWFPGDTPAAPRAFHPAALPAHESAFAMTVHKAQGSEFDEVWLVLPARPNPVLSRELVYTGITRARSALHLVASAPILREALGRHASRWSGLGWRLGATSNETPRSTAPPADTTPPTQGALF